MLAACKLFKKTVGIFKLGDAQFVSIPFKLVSNFAVIKTAYITRSNMDNTGSNKISGNDDFYIDPGVQAMVDDGHYPDAVDFQKFLNKIAAGTRKKKTTKKK